MFIIFRKMKSYSCIDREDLVSGVDVNMGCPKEFSIKVSLSLYVEIM